jgi:hypothetical protein
MAATPAAGSSTSGGLAWWVIGFFPEGTGSGTGGQQPSSTKIIYGSLTQAKQASSLAVNGNYFGPYSTKALAQQAIKSGKLTGNKAPIANAGSTVQNWLTSMGGSIASGLEQGFVSLLTDIWDVIVGPVEVVIGVLFVLGTFILYFKDDLMSLAGSVGMMAMMGGV